MSKHTPGPWRVVRSASCGHLRAAHNYNTGDPRSEWTDADIRLIAAAPDLLAACKAFAAARKAWRECDDMSSIEYLDTLDAIDFDAAIAKAEGGEV